jgi:hypothetical protein
MNQDEWFKRSGEIEHQIHESIQMLEESINLLKRSAYFCREVGKINDGNRSKNINDEVFILLDRIQDLHNYWISEYAAMEDYDF